MPDVTIEVLITAIAQIGIGGIFVWLYINKDRQHQELQDKVLEVFNKQTEMNGELKSVIQKNTEVSDKTLTLTEQVYKELLIGRGRDNR
jgi:hypothetical protein